jgi:Domain of unknown function (DUF4440)
MNAGGYSGNNGKQIRNLYTPQPENYREFCWKNRAWTVNLIPVIEPNVKTPRNMKSNILGLILVIAMVQWSHAQPTETITTSTTNTPEQQELIRLSKQKWDWMADKNVDSLNALFDDKAMFIHMGGTWGKAQELSTIKSGGIWYKKAEVYAVVVNIFGNTAILLNDIDLQAVVGSHEVTNPFMVTEVYINENGKWRLGSLTFSHLLRPVKMNGN